MPPPPPSNGGTLKVSKVTIHLALVKKRGEKEDLSHVTVTSLKREREKQNLPKRGKTLLFLSSFNSHLQQDKNTRLVSLWGILVEPKSTKWKAVIFTHTQVKIDRNGPWPMHSIIRAKSSKRSASHTYCRCSLVYSTTRLVCSWKLLQTYINYRYI